MKYDLVLSLGGSCAVANQLKVRGLRLFSLPFDWLYCTSYHSLEALAIAFKNDFVYWMVDQNMEEMLASDYEKNAARFQYVDRLTGYRFIHDFSQPKEVILHEVREKYQQRIHRLQEYLKCADSIALCFDSNFSNCEVPLQMLRRILLEKFGENKKIDCYWVEFAASSHAITQKDAWNHYQYTHAKPEYIFKEYPTFEFSFMDSFELTSKFKSENRMKGRFFYLVRTHKGVRLWLLRFARPKFEIKMFLGRKVFELKVGQ